jgi:hypothetical protein
VQTMTYKFVTREEMMEHTKKLKLDVRCWEAWLDLAQCIERLFAQQDAYREVAFDYYVDGDANELEVLEARKKIDEKAARLLEKK